LNDLPRRSFRNTNCELSEVQKHHTTTSPAHRPRRMRRMPFKVLSRMPRNSMFSNHYTYIRIYSCHEGPVSTHLHILCRHARSSSYPSLFSLHSRNTSIPPLRILSLSLRLRTRQTLLRPHLSFELARQSQQVNHHHQHPFRFHRLPVGLTSRAGRTAVSSHYQTLVR
jgi:hypothetical protein